MIDLPDPDRTPLARTPLQLVVCQARFEEVLGVSDPRVALSVHERLGGRGGRYPKLEPVKGSRLAIQINVAAGGVVPSETPLAGWRMSSDDGWVVSLMPDSVSLETSNYSNWDPDFRGRLADVIESVYAEVHPATEQRLGLRYVDRLTYPAVEAPQEWRPFIAPEFLGPILHAQLGPAVKTTQQQLILDLGAGVQAVIRHGFFIEPGTDGQPTYLLDFDVSRNEVRAFDVDGIKDGADLLNTRALQLFQQATTPELRGVLAEA